MAMTNPERNADQEAREIVSLYVHNHGRHGEPLSCPSCKKLCVIIAAALQRRDDELSRVREELEDSNGAYRSVMEEACAGGITYDTDDRLHCTCVPHLREGVKALKAQHEASMLEVATGKEHWRLARDGEEYQLRRWAETQRELERLRDALRIAQTWQHQALQAEAQVWALREALADAPDMTCESLEARAWREKYAHLLATPPSRATEEKE